MTDNPKLVHLPLMGASLHLIQDERTARSAHPLRLLMDGSLHLIPDERTVRSAHPLSLLMDGSLHLIHR